MATVGIRRAWLNLSILAILQLDMKDADVLVEQERDNREREDLSAWHQGLFCRWLSPQAASWEETFAGEGVAPASRAHATRPASPQDACARIPRRSGRTTMASVSRRSSSIGRGDLSFDQPHRRGSVQKAGQDD